MRKVHLPNQRQKSHIVNAFINIMCCREQFLVVGHQHPDEDCVASMVAFSLLMSKLHKNPAMILNRENQKNFPCLLNIAMYNSIKVIGSPEEIGHDYDTVIALDTPKPDMLDFYSHLKGLLARDNVLVMEIDHHLEADGEYIGDEGYRLVDESSSTCELIGYLSMKLCKKSNILKDFGIVDFFTRNFALSIVTGMVGDSKMGQFLKTREEKRHYQYFIQFFNEILVRETNKDSDNLASIEDVYCTQEKLSRNEMECCKDFLKHKESKGPIAWIALNEANTAQLLQCYGKDIIITVAKYTANLLAEESSCVSLVAYYDTPEISSLIQLRMRRSQNFQNLDLREVIARIGFSNGGGHEGAVGFRVSREMVTDFSSFIDDIVTKTIAIVDSK